MWLKQILNLKCVHDIWLLFQREIIICCFDFLAFYSISVYFSTVNTVEQSNYLVEGCDSPCTINKINLILMENQNVLFNLLGIELLWAFGALAQYVIPFSINVPVTDIYLSSTLSFNRIIPHSAGQFKFSERKCWTDFNLRESVASIHILLSINILRECVIPAQQEKGKRHQFPFALLALKSQKRFVQ